MSRQLIEFSLENGKSIFVEERCSDEVRRGESEASRTGDFKKKAETTFREAIETAKSAAEVIIKEMDSLKGCVPNCPEEIDVEFGVKLSSKIGVPIISSLDGEINLKITLKWKK
jgi:hypothetical protein